MVRYETRTRDGGDGWRLRCPGQGQYRFDATRAGAPKVGWRVRYDIGVKKPGQFDAGSGTTPTLMGRSFPSITDNADPMQVVVMRRAKRLPRWQRRIVCQQPCSARERARQRTRLSLGAAR